MRRAAVVLLGWSVLAAVAGCGDGDRSGRGDTDDVYTVAFLRAVAGTQASEPTFFDELYRAGYRLGGNLRVFDADPEIAYPDPDDARAAVERWEAEGVDIIVALSSSGAAIAREAAPDTDVLFVSNDPVAAGLVTDEARPEGNLTGVTFRVPADRILELARRVLPGLATVGLAYPDADPAATAHRDALADAAAALDLVVAAERFDEADGSAGAVAALADGGVDALMLSTSPTAARLTEETRAAADAHRLPVIAATPVADGALLTLAPDSDELYRQLGRQAARLLAGSGAGAVPVEDPRAFVLTLDETVARELGVTFPADVVRQANEVRR